MSSQYWCFTINNPTAFDELQLLGLAENNSIIFAFAQLEIGKCGTPHYQGYLELDRHRRLTFIKKILHRAHLEPRAKRSTAQKALQYCVKDTSPTVLSEILDTTSRLYVSNPNDTTNCADTIMISTDKRTASIILSSSQSKKRSSRSEILQTMKTMIDAGATDVELANFDFATYTSSFRGLEKYRLLISKPRNHHTEVYVIQGPTGTGKSKHTLENYPNAYWKQRSNWWDNYNNHDIVVIDEFYGWLPFDLLLRICDRYPLMVETKGGQVNFNASKIIITTNAIPDRWYKNVYFQSFIRRVTMWVVMPTLGSTFEFENYSDAVKMMHDNSNNLDNIC